MNNRNIKTPTEETSPAADTTPDDHPGSETTETAGSVDVSQQAFSAQQVPVRLIDPPPSLDPPPAAGKTPPDEAPAQAADEPAGGTAAEAEDTGEPAAQRVSPWSIPAPVADRVAFSFNLAKLTGQGEDADPILHQAQDLGLVGVFDGMGGAGGTTYSTNEGPRTGAYLASRAARDVVDRRMLELLEAEDRLDGSFIAAELHDNIAAALRARLTDLQAPRSGLRSKLIRALPTTMAMAAVTRHQPENGPWECDLLWAGDSRVYLLRPDTGLTQLTTDDIRDQGDAMTNLRQDSVISNAMSADTAFVINHRRVRLDTPFLIIAATDGCFGYLPSPMHFESLLLSTLRTAPDTEGWSAQLQAQITAISGDDASLAILGIGGDHQQVQSMFAERAASLESRWVDPFNQLDAEIGDLERQLEVLRRRKAQQTAELWATYRPGYEHYPLVGDASERATT